VTKGTKQIGKTLTAMSDSPDRRGQGRLNKLQYPQAQRDGGKKEKIKKTKMVLDGSLGLDTGMY
jgi:hypothetical protein